MLRLTITLLFSCLLSVCFAQNGKVKNLAVFFAVKDYKYPQTWISLNQPIKDARAIANVLNKGYDFDTLVFTNFTSSQISNKIDSLRKCTYDNNAELLLFFSGHGYFHEGFKLGYFIPYEGTSNVSTYLSYVNLMQMIDAIPCKHTLTLIDACYAGTFDGKKFRDKPKLWTSLAATKQVKIETLLKDTTRYFIPSVDNNITPDNSKFVANFLNALNRPNSEGVLTVAGLMSYLQIPMDWLSSFGKHNGGDFLFIQSETEKVLDQDKDGVADKNDLCPDEKCLPCINGCPDTDGDNVPDNGDKCPKIKGLARFGGCPDTDGDDVPDKDDKCPKLKGLAHFYGCPDKDGDGFSEGLIPPDDECEGETGPLRGCLDSDGDGFANKVDKCPYQVGTSPDGCPKSKLRDYTETVNGVSFTMKAIPAGTFMMGCTSEQEGDC
ncbi:MAG: caspase domain-containing protein, partial [Bacteroidia bacterium]